MTLSIIVLALVTAQRLGELVLANRNTRRLLAMGATEHGASALSADRGDARRRGSSGFGSFGWNRPIDPFWLIVFVVLQALAGLGDQRR